MALKKTNKRTTAKAKAKSKGKSTKTPNPKYIFLDIGCGQNKQSVEGLFNQAVIAKEQVPFAKVIGIDNQKAVGVDKVWDLTKFPYPFKDNSIDGVFSSHFLEHLDGLERIKFFDEMQRIMKTGGKMRHIHPYYKSDRAQQDPTHKFPAICEQSYMYWNKDWREANRLGHYLGNSNFGIVNMAYTWQDATWATKNAETRDFAIRHYWNIIADLIVDLVKL